MPHHFSEYCVKFRDNFIQIDAKFDETPFNRVRGGKKRSKHSDFSKNAKMFNKDLPKFPNWSGAKDGKSGGYRKKN